MPGTVVNDDELAVDASDDLGILNSDIGGDESIVTESEPIESDKDEVLGDSGLPIDIENAIITCDTFYRKEDESVRNVMIAFWKKLDNLFNGIQRTFWDSQASDWRRFPSENSDDVIEPVLYDRIINLYRAHGESLIAALSIKLPTVNFLPDDADVSEDVDAAKAYNKISDIIVKHNQGILIFIRALFLHYNQGLVGAYIYNRSNKDYGTVQVPKYGKDKTLYHYLLQCPVCGYEHQETSESEINFDGPIGCPDCKSMVVPDVKVDQELLPTITGYDDIPKSRTVIDVFGPLYVQTSLSARKQELLPYIRLRFESENALLRQQYKGMRDKIPIRSGGDQADDRYARNFTNFGYLENTNRSTVTCGWLRPWAFQVLDNIEIIEKCQTRFPDGCYYELMNNNVVLHARNENMDKKWVFTEHPLSDKLHCDPMGKPLAPIQDLKTEIVDLAIETIEHGIPETFADPQVLDFSKYGKSRAEPGRMTKAKRPSNGSLAEGFHTIKAAQLTEDLQSFDKELDVAGQFVVGSFPSIYGGPAQSGSKTASEYSESRAMARQRLNTTWTMFKYWWAKVVGISVTNYIECMMEDERYVQKSPQAETGFVNVWITLSELQGKVGSIEPDPDEELPTSFAQIKNSLMELIGLNNEAINSGLFSAPNLPLLKRAMGLADLYIPGQQARDKQFAEFKDLLQGIPVLIEPDVDDHGVESDTCQFFLTSSTGIYLKKINPMGWMAIAEHKRGHDQIIAEREQARMEAESKLQNENEEKE